MKTVPSYRVTVILMAIIFCLVITVDVPASALAAPVGSAIGTAHAPSGPRHETKSAAALAQPREGTKGEGWRRGWKRCVSSSVAASL